MTDLLLARQIVCGAKNFHAGDKVALALPGAVLPGGMKIKVSKLRGVESEGMLCSPKELHLADDAAGLLILPADASVGSPLSGIFPPDTVIEVEVTPNRPDLLSHFGIARELAALIDLPEPALPKIVATPESTREDSGVVRLEASAGCPFYSARLLRGIRVGPSPGWLRQRLEAVGLRSINNVVDVTNYVLLELGQPLHAFDAARIRGGIVVRLANPGEELLALDGKDYELGPDDVVIADHDRALAIAGVMGGERSGVVATTTEILLESAYFNPGFIRRTSRRLGLISDSSFRFERGVDPEAVTLASARAVDLLLQVAGGRVDESIVVAGSVPNLAGVVEMRPERCNSLLGMDVPDSAKLLTRLKLKPAGGNRWEIPSFRQDLTREVDLIEEVCRMAGIQRIPSRVYGSATRSSAADAAYDELMELRRRLVGLGLFEARTLTLVDEHGLDFLVEPRPEAVVLRNPLVEDQRYLRPSLIPGLVRAAERNFNRGSSSVAIFEIGRVFRFAAKEESICLSLLLSGERKIKSWNQDPAVFDLFDLKGILKAALRKELTFAKRNRPASLRSFVMSSTQMDAWWVRSARCGPAWRKRSERVAPFWSPNSLLQAGGTAKEFKYKPLDRFPAVTRDVAFLADRELKYQAVLDAFASAGERLLVDVRLFDLFMDPSGEKVPADKKSMACSLTYRASDRTLTQEEANAAHGRLKSQLVERLGVTLRE